MDVFSAFLLFIQLEQVKKMVLKSLIVIVYLSRPFKLKCRDKSSVHIPYTGRSTICEYQRPRIRQMAKYQVFRIVLFRQPKSIFASVFQSFAIVFSMKSLMASAFLSQLVLVVVVWQTRLPKQLGIRIFCHLPNLRPVFGNSGTADIWNQYTSASALLYNHLTLTSQPPLTALLGTPFYCKRFAFNSSSYVRIYYLCE